MYRVSIIIPAYNSEETIELCLEKVINESKNFESEIIVVDDNSDDRTAEIVKKFKSVKGDVKDTVIGSFKQYPIKIAWAITIHKSQGQTFDKFIVDMSTGAFAHGQTYVALSRATNFKGIYLKSSIKLSDIKFDKRILNFIDE